jgi:uncharacterized protein (TIGR03435 family)
MESPARVLRPCAVPRNSKGINIMKTAVTILFLACCSIFAQVERPEFDAATVRPYAPQTPDGGLKMIGTQADPGMVRMMAMRLLDLVCQAYHVKYYQVEGPAWTKTERYDITAKMPAGTPPETRRLMEQNLLADRFHLSVHHETKEVQVYALVVGKNGLKMQPVPADRPGPGGYTRFHGPGHIECVKISLPAFADMISGFADHPVIDKTDVKDLFDFKLDFAMDPALLMAPGFTPKPAPRTESADQDLPSLFTAVQTLGLRLEPKKESMDIIVIDHAEKTPTEN